VKLLYPLFKGANVALVIITLLSFIAPLVDPVSLWMIAILGLFYPWIVLFNFLFMLFWIFSSKPKWAILSGAILILSWGYTSRIINFNSETYSLSPDVFNVMSFNVNEMQISAKAKKEEKAKIHAEIKDHITHFGVPEILCVQDMIKDNLTFFKDFMQYPHQHILGGQRVMTGIFSKFPIKESGIIKFEKSYNSCIWTDLKIGDQIIRVYCIHLESNRITEVAEEVITEGNLNEESTRQKIRNMFSRYKNSTAMRSEQAGVIKEHMDSCPHPVLLCGDFNDTPFSKAYKILSKGLTDSFKHSGRGIGTTYAGGIPGLRIDYIFADSNFEILKHQTLKNKVISDHYPVFSSMILNDNKSKNE